MNAADAPSAAFSDSRPHYVVLDGLRGVAALVVLGFHVFEAFATSPFDQKFNHGYLAVDFFFMLSGFVIGYAYDARWRGNGNPGGMTTADFFKRRLVRLHPMICVGALLGIVSFFVQGRVRWDGTEVGVPAEVAGTLFFRARGNTRRCIFAFRFCGRG